MYGYNNGVAANYAVARPDGTGVAIGSNYSIGGGVGTGVQGAYTYGVGANGFQGAQVVNGVATPLGAGLVGGVNNLGAVNTGLVGGVNTGLVGTGLA